MELTQVHGAPHPIAIGTHAIRALADACEQGRYSQLFVVADEHTAAHCYPLLAQVLPPHSMTVIPAGEAFKHLETLATVWQAMTDRQLDRKSALIALGGGVVGDLAGFAAGTYKRGIPFFQVPTTLLSMVDASVGGKTGIDFHGLKNHIGVFHQPAGVFIYPGFLHTLPPGELLSGFGEVVKHHLIRDRAAWQVLRTHTHPIGSDLSELIAHSVRIKANIVAADPTEKGLRKGLNFGHTLGHAIETWLLNAGRPTLHGFAIAAGMWMEAYISRQSGLLSEEEWSEIQVFIRAHFPALALTPGDFEAIFALTAQDKKNEAGRVNYVLLNGIGDFVYDQVVEKPLAEAAFNAYLAG